MDARPIFDDVLWMGAVDWDRRLFDSLIPLPDGTSYNAYLLQGTQGTALLDSVDPPMTAQLLDQLEAVPSLDYVVSHHAEQDHSGAIPAVLERYPNARVVATERGQDMLVYLLGIPRERIRVVANGEELSLGSLTLRFLHMPWVHWAETMVTYVPERQAVFTCDFLASHLATSELFAEWTHVEEAAKRYYGEIMMPFRDYIKRHVARLRELDVKVIAPSHGPLHADPTPVLAAWEEWASDRPHNLVTIAYVSMHGSTRRLVQRLVSALAARRVRAEVFDLASVDLGRLAISLVDAATIVVGTPTVLGGPHPLAVFATHTVAALRPKARFASLIGSYGWGGRVAELLTQQLAPLRVEVLSPVLCKGRPREDDLAAIDALAEQIANAHRQMGL